MSPLAKVLVVGVAVFGVATSAFAGNAQAGKAKAVACSTCHGLDGRSRLPNAPHLTGQNSLYTALQLRAYRSGQRQNAQMNVVAQGLTDQDIEDLAAYYESLGASCRCSP